MIIERTKNATRNIVYGGVLKIYQILMPFIMRTAMIYWLGVQYLGLNSLFTSLLQVLNLAELGVGSAMVYSMYKPIVDNDRNTICALMNLYKKYYRIIGLVILGCGMILTPFIPNLIKGDVPADINIYILYLLNLGATVLSYWLFAYKNCILTAYQRNDLISKVTIVTNTLQYGIQLSVLYFLKNYYLFLIVALATQAFTNILTAFVANKYYPQYKAEGKLEKAVILDINRRIKDLFTSKIGSVIVNSVDTLVISAFLGLSILAVYQNYFYILSSIIGIISVVFISCTAGIGNSVIVETAEKNFSDLKKVTFLICWIAGVCACCLLCLYQPFMVLWVGKKYLLDFSVVICFCIYFFIYEINQLLNTYKDAAGIWHEDRFRPLVTALANLIMNLIMVQFWGIYGVVLSTVFSTLFIGMPWLLHNLFTLLFEKKDLKKYIIRLLYYGLVTIISCFITYMICSYVPFTGWLLLIIRGIICVCIPNLIYFVVFYRLPEFKQSVQLVNKMTGNRITFLKKMAE